LLAGTADNAVGETINLGSGFEITINDLAKEVAFVAGKKHAEVFHDKPRPGDVLRLYAQTTKASKLLGFEPQTTLSEGLLKLKEWYLELGQSLESLLEQEVVHNWNLDGVEQNV
jgi:UDP-glucose 4-epimerase